MAVRESIVSNIEEFFVNFVDPLAVFANDGTIGAINPAWSKVLGWDPMVFHERPFNEFLHSGDVARSDVEAPAPI